MSNNKLPDPHPTVFTTMQIPTPLVKYGQQGNPHYRYFYISTGRSKLIWHSDKKKAVPTQSKFFFFSPIISDLSLCLCLCHSLSVCLSRASLSLSAVSISSMISLEPGQKSAIFSKNKKNLHPDHLSFSVYYKLSSHQEEKTLDVVCKDEPEYTLWVTGLSWLIENKDQVTAAANEIDGKDAGRRGSLKIVDVANLRKEMNAHLDLCTWGNSSWGQLGHAEKPEEIKDYALPTVALSLCLLHLSLLTSVSLSLSLLTSL
jgi:hypothetical protein